MKMGHSNAHDTINYTFLCYMAAIIKWLFLWYTTAAFCSLCKKQKQQKPSDPWHCHTHQVMTARYHYLKIKDWNTGCWTSGHWTKTQVLHPVSSRNYTLITDLAGCLSSAMSLHQRWTEREKENFCQTYWAWGWSLTCQDLIQLQLTYTMIQWLVFQSSMKNATCAKQQNISQAKTGPDTIK